MAKRPGAAKARTLRLERGEGKERVFWEIACTKATITTRFGRWLNEGRTVEKRVADAAEAERVFLEMIAGKRAEGYAEPPKKLAPGAASAKGVSARNAELEALIDADPRDPQGYLVYADWLQQQRDVRGELIVVQHGLSLDPDDAVLDRAETTLFKGFEKELLGPLARYTHIRSPDRSYQGLEWRHGFLSAARLRPLRAPLSEVVRALLEHPSGRFLQRLILGNASYGSAQEPDLGATFGVLAKHAPVTLDWLLLGDGSSEVASLAPLWDAMPRLRSLVLAGPCSTFGTVRAEALEELVVGSASDVELAAIAAAQWPKLRRLSLTLLLSSEALGWSLAPLFASPGLPSLTHLTVQWWMTVGPQALLLPRDTDALVTLRFAALRRLERLDLQVPLSKEGVQAILDLPSLASIGTIAIPAAAIDDPSLRARVAERLPNVVFGQSPLEWALGDLEPLQGALAGSGPSRDARNE